MRNIKYLNSNFLLKYLFQGAKQDKILKKKLKDLKSAVFDKENYSKNLK